MLAVRSAPSAHWRSAGRAQARLERREVERAQRAGFRYRKRIVAALEVHAELGSLGAVSPTHDELRVARAVARKLAAEGRMRVAQANQRAEVADDGPLERRVDLAAFVVVAV